VRRAAFAFTFLFAATAFADPVTLRFATIVPEGTVWAREVRAFSHDVETLTGGAVRSKWYMGGIAGDDLAALDRIKRGQLDGEAGSQICDRLAPSLRVTRLIGLFQTHEELLYIVRKLQAQLDAEYQKNGYVSLGVGSGFGDNLFFSRTPARSLVDLRHGRYWVWDLDDVTQLQLGAMGIGLVPAKIEDAARGYDEHLLDGFVAIPAAALAYQWSTQARFFTELRTGFLPACMVISTTAFDALPLEHQQAVRQAAARLLQRFDEVGDHERMQLIGGLFEKQGMTRVPVSPALRDEFFHAAEAAREKLGAKLVPDELLRKVTGWLAELRAQKK
jgi:TRAP-type C4-dicarboxylate transport system substrate-binding protein